MCSEFCLLRICAVADECEQRLSSFIHVVKLFSGKVLWLVIYDLHTLCVTTQERFRAPPSSALGFHVATC